MHVKRIAKCCDTGHSIEKCQKEIQSQKEYSNVHDSNIGLQNL